MRVKTVTYHYVRPLGETRYPRIKGQTLEGFDRQLDWLGRDHIFISMADLLQALGGSTRLPERSVLLTFDDGYLDHYQFVFPRLLDRGVSGAFYPVASVVEQGKVLDVNKIHFVLASGESSTIAARLFELIGQSRDSQRIASDEELRTSYFASSRWDDPEVAMIKRLLQVGLPDPSRVHVLDRLFEDFVGVPESAFARELYMDEVQLQCMADSGMHIGGHGLSHRRLSHLDSADLDEEVGQSAALLKRLAVSSEMRTFCYPHGDWSEAAVASLRSHGFQAALALEGRTTDISKDNQFALPRLDTNQVPIE